MKNILAVLVVFVGANCFASSVCIVSGVHTNTTFDQIRVNCDDTPTHVSRSKGATWEMRDISPVLQKMVQDGYKIITQSGDAWTLIKD
jgi:hypothetical protein